MVKSDKFHNSKVQNQEREDHEGDQLILALSTTFICRLLPQSISRGRRRCRTDQEEQVFHEHAVGHWRTGARKKGVRQREETSWPAEQVWPPGSEGKLKRKVVTENGREFDIKYRFEEAAGDRGQHGGQRGHF
jgi:hypothetical protein